YPRACSVLGDPFRPYLRKLTLHFEENGAPATHGPVGWFGRDDECLKQFPTASARERCVAVDERRETVRLVIAGIVAFGTPLQQRNSGQQVVAHGIHEKRIRRGI